MGSFHIQKQCPPLDFFLHMNPGMLKPSLSCDKNIIIINLAFLCNFIRRNWWKLILVWKRSYRYILKHNISNVQYGFSDGRVEALMILLQVLKVYPFPITITTFHFAIGTVLIWLMWVTNLYKRPKISSKQVLNGGIYNSWIIVVYIL